MLCPYSRRQDKKRYAAAELAPRYLLMLPQVAEIKLPAVAEITCRRLLQLAAPSQLSAAAAAIHTAELRSIAMLVQTIAIDTVILAVNAYPKTVSVTDW